MQFRILLLSLLLMSVSQVTGQVNDHEVMKMFFNDVIERSNSKYNETYKNTFAIASFVADFAIPTTLDKYLKQYNKFDVPPNSPEQMLQEYNSRLHELEIWSNDIMFQMQTNLERDIQIIIEQTQQQLLSLGVNATTGTADVDNILKQVLFETAGKEIVRQIIRKKEENIIEKRKIYEAELDRKLKRKMEGVRDQLIDENEIASTQYLYAAAYSLSLQEQNNYIRNYNFHQCCISFLIENFNHKDAKWLKIVCDLPAANSSLEECVQVSNFELSKIKYTLYQELENDNFLKAANLILEFDIDEDNIGFDYYIFRSEIGISIIDKLYYLIIASQTSEDFSKNELIEEYRVILNNKLKAAVDNNNNSFLYEYSSKFSFSNINFNGEPIIHYMIQNNKHKLLETIISSFKMEGKPFEEFDGELVGLTILYNSYNCFKELIRIGLNLDVVYSGLFDIYYLTLKDLNSEFIGNLVDNEIDFSTTLKYLKNSERHEEVRYLSIEIYKAKPEQEMIRTLSIYIEDFINYIPTSKRVLISSKPEGLEFNINNKVKGITPTYIDLEYDEYSVIIKNKGVSLQHNFSVLTNNEDEFIFNCKILPKYVEQIGPYSIPFVFVEMENNQNGFYISQFEISEEIYNYIMDIHENESIVEVDLPVSHVSQTDAFEFCKRLNGQLMYNQSIKTTEDTDNIENKLSFRYRLPTKLEWIQACKGGNRSKGHEIIDPIVLNQVAWYRKNSKKIKNPIGKKAPNEFEIYDLLGNISEWCTENINDGPEKCFLMGYSFTSNYNDLKQPFIENEVCIDFNCAGIRIIRSQNY